jgi:flotillin
MKIQNVQDEVKYLDSLGRKRNAEVISKARTAEAIAHADSEIQTAENNERQKRAQIEADTNIAKAEAQRRLTETLTRRTALVAEEQSQVVAAVAQARAELEVQKARIEQVRMKLEADIVAPAIANAEASEANAKAQTAYIIEEGKARADALRLLAETYRQAGPSARQVLLTQKLNGIITALTDTIPMTNVDKVTMIDARAGGGTAGKAISAIEQIKQLFGIDLVEKINSLGNGAPSRAIETVAAAPAPVPVATVAAPSPPPRQNPSPIKPSLAEPPNRPKPPPKVKED